MTRSGALSAPHARTHARGYPKQSGTRDTPRRPWVVHVDPYKRDPHAGSIVIVHAPDRTTAERIARRAGHNVRQVIDPAPPRKDHQ